MPPRSHFKRPAGSVDRGLGPRPSVEEKKSSSSKKGRKRKGSAAGLSSPSRASSRVKQAVDPGFAVNMDSDEELDPQEDGEEELAAEERSFWSLWSTALLFAWTQDYSGTTYPDTKQSAKDREALLDWLVSNATRPAGNSASAQLLAMQVVWRNQNPGKELVPAMYLPPSTPAMATKSPAVGGPKPRPSVSISTPAAITVESESEEMDGDDDFGLQSRAVSKPAPPKFRSKCGTCLTPVAAAQLDEEGAFLCSGCELRGDLPAEHPTNQLLATRTREKHALAMAKSSVAVPVVASPVGASDSSSGKSVTSDTSATTALDRELAQLAKAGAEYTAFVSREPISVEEAQRVVQSAYDASGFCMPSEELVKLIQSGKLVNPGYAIPRRIGEDFRGKKGRTVLAQDGSLRVEDDQNVPVVNSPLTFLDVLVTTIGPALIEQPRALVQWFALARSMVLLAQNSQNDWSPAMIYLNRLLHERVHRRDKAMFASYDANMVSEARAMSYMMTHQPQSFSVSQSRHPAGAAGPRPSALGECCFDWNGGRCHATPCPRNRRHVCRHCGSPDHFGVNCPVAPPLGGSRGASAPSGSGGSQRGGGSGSRGGRGRGDGVRATRPAATAVSAAASSPSL